MVNYRPMGTTELEVSEVGFGLWTLTSGRWGSFNDEQAVDLLRKAYDSGINYFDVSPMDGSGRGERLLSKAFRERRELVVVSSKVGRTETGADFTPSGIRTSLEGTLERLESPYVDLLQLHYPDATAVADPGVWQTLESLRSDGKLRYYGIALGPGPGGLEEGRAAMRKQDLGCIQIYYNLLEEEPGRNFFPVALEIGQAVVVRAPHAGGALESGSLDATVRPADGDLQIKDAAWLGTAAKRASSLKWIHDGKGMTMSQAALKFILSEETVASTIPNIYREDQLAEYGGVSDFPNFEQWELAEIAEQFRKGFGVP
ncbi:MAG TPA: aldo/keto reductase [Thermoplasmata archaeon]|nr:aldo/keto reductase [Thermoplasmata archaeon]